jgi:hypothetical protein
MSATPQKTPNIGRSAVDTIAQAARIKLHPARVFEKEQEESASFFKNNQKN